MSRPGAWTVFAAGAALALILVGTESILALIIVLLDGMAALLVLSAAGLAGGWGIRLWGLKNDLPTRLILGAGLGIGLLSLSMLGLGAMGLLSRTAAFVLVGILAIAGLARLGLDLHEIGVFRIGGEGPVPKPPRATGSSLAPAWRWLWLAAVPFVAIMLMAAALPPGVLWTDEAGAYDALEYHLAAPKHWAEQGRISFLPTNVYTDFPLNSEMITLLMMLLRGDAIEGAYMAVAANGGLALLLMAAAWLAGRQFSARSGMIAGVLAGTTPWTAYLAGVAYVEVGMLAMGMCALAAAICWARMPAFEASAGAAPVVARSRLPIPLLAGALAGLSWGFKYPAGPMIVAPVGAVLLCARRKSVTRAGALVVFGFGAFLTFCPWMIRNVVHTGNPFFPLAYSVFGDRSGTWDEELHARWRRAHGSALAERTRATLGRRIWDRSVADPKLGAAVLILAAIGAARRRDRWTAVLLAMLAGQAAVWILGTHLLARFIVPGLLPLILLASRAIEARAAPIEDSGPQPGTAATGRVHGDARPRWLDGVVLVILIAGCGHNLYRLQRLYYDDTRPGGTNISAYGHAAWFVEGQWPGTQHFGAINALPEDSRVMLVGEARTFYLRRECEYAVVFNRHPLADVVEQTGGDAAAVIRWLRDRGITHLLVHLSEINRLAGTYGFDAPLRQPGSYVAGLRELPVKDQQPYFVLFEVPRP